MQAKESEFKIQKIVQETESVRSFYLESVQKEEFEFVPGQFVLVSLPQEGGKTLKRAYSISSCPNGECPIRITMNLHGEFTAKMFSKNEGDPLLVAGPYGNFVFDAKSPDDAVFIAGGVGVTPLISMIMEAAKASPEKKLALFYSSRDPGHMPFLGELEKIAGNNPNFKLIVTITGDKKIEGRETLSGRIDGNMLRNALGELGKKTYYVCGPRQMVEGVIELLETLGIDSEKIKTERW